MKTVKKNRVVLKTPLTVEEKGHMKLAQESIDHGAYNPPKSKEETLRNAVEIALKQKANQSL